jgi:hypothetical protein
MLIVTTILPLIIGALAVGIISVFKLKASVSNRLGDTADAQQISSMFANDITGAQYVTTQATSTPQCGAGTGTQFMGLETNFNTVTGKFGITTSYVRVPVVTATSTTYNLERLVCSGEGVYSPTSTNILAYDFSSTAALAINCTANAPTSIVTSPIACSSPIAGSQWMSTESVGDIELPVTEPASGFSYNLAASPINSISSTVTGSPVSNSASATCNAALVNTGRLSSTLCFVDFSQFNNPAVMSAARSGSCQEMSVKVGSSNVLYFCLSISGSAVTPVSLPTYPEAFLGNAFCLANLGGSYTSSTTCLPFYSGITGLSAFYQPNRTAQSTTFTFSGITVENASGQSATGWHIVSADAESTDANSSLGESVTWTADTPLSPLCNGEAWDSCAVPNSYGNYDWFGNACLNDQPTSGVVQSPDLLTLTCNGSMGSEKVTSGFKSGTAMVQATTPTSLSVTIASPYGGKQGFTFGLSVSGIS